MSGSAEMEVGGDGARLVRDLARRARERLPEEVWRYFDQGAGEGLTAGEAETAWDRYRLVPRVLVDVTHVDRACTLLGTEVDSPFAVAPMTLQRAAHPDGELATARAVAAQGSLMVVSSNAGTTFEQIAGTGAAWWLQIYVTADRTRSLPVIERAVAAGARALVLTADTPVVASKAVVGRSVWDVADPSWVRVNFDADGGSPGDAEKAADLGPHDVAWLAERSGVPVVVKGVLDGVDARRCVDAGAAAVWVSNHGGRQLDGAVATVDALAEIGATLGPDVELYVDGGVRRGAQALVAAALGARAVFVGRPVLHALAADGEAGVAALLASLGAELDEALRLSGRPALAGVGRDLLRDVGPGVRPL